ncbi:MAG: hypothetical protein AB7U38_14500 [Hyphomicrobiales bacterium]
MQLSQRFRVRLAAFLAVIGISFASMASAASGSVSITVVKAGWFVGGSGGSGTLSFQGRRYPLSIGGISAGLVFGASKATLSGRVSNIRRASDVAGVYGAAGAGVAAGRGRNVIVLTNEKGAVLELSGSQAGLIVNLDLSGMAITLK